MKKTLVLLTAALCSVASAMTAEEFNTMFPTLYTDGGYTTGNPFEAVVELSGINDNGAFMSFGSNFYLVTQAYSGNLRYIGINNQANNSLSMTNVSVSIDSETAEAVTLRTYNYISEQDTIPTVWFQNGEATNSEPRNLSSITVRVSTDGTDSFLDVNYGTSPYSNWTDHVVLKGTVLNATDVQISNSNVSATLISAAPEPATATLSLLALAALAARRKRY